MSDVITPRIRTARKVHYCQKCHQPIQPGERYEDYRLPPWREPNESPAWWCMKLHVAAYPIGLGCDEARAYRERAERERLTATP